MAEVSGGTVKLRITRPGASPEFGFFVEKNAANEMGSAGTLEWVDGQGKIAVNELESNIIRSQAGGGKIDFESTVMFGTIEGRDGVSIFVANNLDLGGNNLTTTGDGEFGTLNATKLGRSINAAGFNITGAGTLSATTLTASGASGTVTGATGTFTTLNATNLGGSINAAGYNITGADTVSGTTGNFTNLTASKLTLGGQTGTSASPYNVYVTNSNLLGGVNLETLRAEIADAKNSASGVSYKTIKTVPVNYGTYDWVGTWEEFCTLAGLPSTTIAIMVMVPSASTRYIEGENSGSTVHHFEYIPKLYTQETLYSGENRNIKGKIVVRTYVIDCTVSPQVVRRAYILK